MSFSPDTRSRLRPAVSTVCLAVLAALLVALLPPAPAGAAPLASAPGTAAPAAAPLPAASPDASRLVSGWFGWWNSPATVESVAARGGSVLGDAMIFMWSFNGAGDPACLIDPNNGGNCTSGATTSRYMQSRDALRARGIQVYASHTDLNHTLRRQLSGYLASAGNRQAMADLLTAKAVAAGVDGVDLDWENFAFNDGSSTWSDTRPRFVDTVRRLSAALHAAGKKLSVTVPAGYAPFRNGAPNDSGGYWVFGWSEIAPHVDRLRLMAYDYSVGNEGPIGPNNWAAETVRSAKLQVGGNSHKLYIGVHQYGRDWVRKSPSGGYITANCPGGWRPNAPTSSRSLSAVRQIQSARGARPNLEGTYQEWWFDYMTEVVGTATVNGSLRSVTCSAQRRIWFGDQHTAKARMDLVGDYGIGGIAVWNLGGVEADFFSGGLADSARRIGNDTRLPAGSVLEVPVAGAKGVPANAAAALLTLTVFAPTDPGHLRVYPCGTPRPNTSALNFGQLQTIAGSALSAVGSNGKVCVYTSASAHILVDTAGSFPVGGGLEAGPGQRLLDTRTNSMPGRGTEVRVPIPDAAAAAAVTVTATGSAAGGFVKAYPCDGQEPPSSMLNYRTGQTIANTVPVALGPGGDICLRSSTPTHLIIDYAGRFLPDSDLAAQPAARLFDSRSGPRPASGAEQRIKAPAGAVALAVVLTITQPASGGHAVAYPCGAVAEGVSHVNFRAGQSIANTALVAVGADGHICVRSSAPTHLIVDNYGAIDTAPDLRLSAGARLLDTRETGPVPPGGVVRARVPDLSAAAAITVTAVAPATAGWVTAYPCDAPRPGTSLLNFDAGQTVANSTILPVGDSQEVCVYSRASAHILIDYAGHVPPGSDFAPGGPSRILDTRSTSPVEPGESRAAEVPGALGPALLNLTVVRPEGGGHLVLVPCGSAPSDASSLNYAPGQVVANLATAQAGEDGRVCVRTTTPAEVIIDHAGSFTEGSDFAPVTPRRLADTRSGTRPQPRQLLRVRVPDVAAAAAVNITVTDAQAPGHVRAWPCGMPVPDSSVLNFAPGRSTAGATVIGVGSGQEVCLWASASAHLVVDYSGYVAPTTYDAVRPVRLIDTRR